MCKATSPLSRILFRMTAGGEAGPVTPGFTTKAIREEIMKLLKYAALALALSAGAARADDISIAGVIFQQDMFMRSVELGMKAAAKQAGVEILTANSDNKLEKEAALIDTYIARGIKAIVIAPLGEEASIPALKRAVDAGIKVVTWTTGVKSDLPVATVGSSGTNMGKGTGEAAAAYIKDHLGGKAKVALIGFRAQLASLSDERTNGFLDAAKSGGELDIVSRQDAWLAEQAVRVVTDMLTANPDIQIIYAANEGGTVGAVQAVMRAGRQGEVYVFGTDGSEQIVRFLQDEKGALYATTAAQPKLIGEDAVKAAIAAVKGEPVERHIEVPVIPLSRANPEAIAAYAATLTKTN